MRQELLSIYLCVTALSELKEAYDAHLQEHDTAAQFGGYVPLDDDYPVEVPLRLLRIASSAISRAPAVPAELKFDDHISFEGSYSRFDIDGCRINVHGGTAVAVSRNLAAAYLAAAPAPSQTEAPSHG